MEFSVRVREISVLEKEELEFPEARRVNAERVSLGPVLAVREDNPECRPCCAVELDGLIVSRGRVSEELYANEVDSHRVIYAGGLVVRDGEDNRSRLGDVKRSRVARGVPSGTENIEFGELVPWPRNQRKEGQSDRGEDDTRSKDNRESFVERSVLDPTANIEL